VTVTLNDGRSATRSLETHRGDFNDPFTDSEMRGKFRELAATVLNADGVAVVEAAVDRCTEWTNAGELTALLRRHARA
jgi:hypothetical protein